MVSSGDPGRPKVAIAVAERFLRERLISVLERAGVDVWSSRSDRGLQRTITETDADVIVLSRSQIPPDGVEVIDSLTEVGDGPEIVVVTDRESPADRARLLAAGAARVVNEDSANRDMEDTLESVANAAADGALDGPEVGGNAVEPRLADFNSRSPRMRRFMRTVRKIIDTETSLLITGETGVGKERLARAIHNESGRSAGPFVAVNCAALSENLLESELFGHEKGSFTGATSRRRGCFELANGGTLFLDEICETSTALQVKLLTAIQRREIMPVGGESTKRIDVRIMAATNKRVEDEVAAGRFREDLYYRLNVMPLEIPPLRDRLEDIPDLVGTILGHFRQAMRRAEVTNIDDDALRALARHDYPGNVRELVNVVERAMIECEGPTLTRSNLPPALRAQSRIGDGSTAVPASWPSVPEQWCELPLREARRRLLDEFERSYLKAQLRKTRGAVGETARRAGITTRSLYDKMKRHDLRKEDFRG